MKKRKLSTQITLVFSLSIIIMFIMFVTFFTRSIREPFEYMAKQRLEEYKSIYMTNENYNDYPEISVIYMNMNDTDIYYSDSSKVILNAEHRYTISSELRFYNNRDFFVIPYETEIDSTNTKIFTLMYKVDGQSVAISTSYNLASDITTLNAFSNIFVICLFSYLLGLALILIWSRFFINDIDRIKHKIPITYESTNKNEINQLEDSIDAMLEDIENQRKIRKDMIQNISHDLKTPVSIIKSYAEAIEDGVMIETDLESHAVVIIKQADKLSNKIKKLIHINKLNYLLDDHVLILDNISLFEIIYKLLPIYENLNSNIDFNVNSDSSMFRGTYDEWEIVIENILENAIRYAKEKIEIVIKNSSLIIFNDGDNISNEILKNIFSPYIKGNKGNFGLGMTIIYQTVSLFNYDIEINNLNIGVQIVIKPSQRILS